MTTIPGNVALAGLLTLTLILTGCASHAGADPSGANSASQASLTSATAPAGNLDRASGSTVDNAGYPVTAGTASSGAIGASGTAGMSGSGDDAQTEGTGTATRQSTPATPPNSTVLAIEIMPAAGGSTEADATMGASGTSGATGSTASGQSFRVTLRLDDGSTQVVTHSTTPDFRSGDRVHVKGGTIVR